MLVFQYQIGAQVRKMYEKYESYMCLLALKCLQQGQSVQICCVAYTKIPVGT